MQTGLACDNFDGSLPCGPDRVGGRACRSTLHRTNCGGKSKMTSILGCTASCGSSGISGSRKETGLDWKRQKTWQIAGIPPRIYSVYSDLVGFKVILVFFIQVPIVSEIHLYHPRYARHIHYNYSGWIDWIDRTKEVRLVPVPSIQPPYGCRGIRGGKFTLKFVPILTSIEFV